MAFRNFDKNADRTLEKMAEDEIIQYLLPYESNDKKEHYRTYLYVDLMNKIFYCHDSVSIFSYSKDIRSVLDKYHIIRYWK